MKKALKSILSITLCLIMLLGTISGTFMRFCDIIKNPFSLSHPQNRPILMYKKWTPSISGKCPKINNGNK